VPRDEYTILEDSLAKTWTKSVKTISESAESIEYKIMAVLYLCRRYLFSIIIITRLEHCHHPLIQSFASGLLTNNFSVRHHEVPLDHRRPGFRRFGPPR